jgi:hypothetical protein
LNELPWEIQSLQDQITALQAETLFLCPQGVELTMALVNLEQFGYWAAQAILRSKIAPPEPSRTPEKLGVPRPEVK